MCLIISLDFCMNFVFIILFPGGFIFNSEAHPVDPAALNCCSAHTEEEVKKHISDHMLDILDPKTFNEFQGDLIPQRIDQIRVAREEEAANRKRRKEEYERRMEEQRIKEREAVKRKKELEELRRKMKEDEDKEKKSKEFVDEDGTIVIEGTVVEKIEDDKTFGDIGDDYEELFETEDNEETSGNMSMNPKLSDLEFEPEFKEEDKMSPNPRLIQSEDDPEFTEETKSVPVPEDQPDQVLIKRQSKDETTETLPAPVVAKEKRVADNVVEAITVIINKLLPATRKEFDQDDFTNRVMKKDQYVLNDRWYKDHFVMSCPAQGFLQRFSLQGEFFDQY